MVHAWHRTICWTPLWNKDREGVGLEYLLLAEGVADSVVLAFDEAHGPFRLTYRLTWDKSWRLHDAELAVMTERATRALRLQTDGQGHWRHGDGRAIAKLAGCVDVVLALPILALPILASNEAGAEESCCALDNPALAIV
ncbi:MAG: putative glycolipid-binding domain-containing protein [Chloroflexales bacterium]|nr:putative glycolipid-binding domain-containing protein [Chloroflexales bacterium]